jgi:hypothetical protein
MEYRKKLDDIIFWLTKAENAVQKQSTTELEENLKELTVSRSLVFICQGLLMHRQYPRYPHKQDSA